MSININSAEIENCNHDIKEKEDEIDEVTFPKLVSLLTTYYHYCKIQYLKNYFNYHYHHCNYHYHYYH